MLVLRSWATPRSLSVRSSTASALSTGHSWHHWAHRILSDRFHPATSTPLMATTRSIIMCTRSPRASRLVWDLSRHGLSSRGWERNFWRISLSRTCWRVDSCDDCRRMIMMRSRSTLIIIHQARPRPRPRRTVGESADAPREYIDSKFKSSRAVSTNILASFSLGTRYLYVWIFPSGWSFGLRVRIDTAYRDLS